MKILFVCHGNTCRSPMAELLAKEHFQQKGTGHQVLSAGLQGEEGERASKGAISVMKELGLDLQRHRTRRVSRDLVEGADLVLTMTLAQRDLLRIAYYDIPDGDQRIHTLSGYAGTGDQDIPDPFMGNLEAYRHVRDRLKELIEKSEWEERA